MSMSYVGIKKCGCAVAAVVDDGEHIKDTSKVVSKFIRDGLSVERWPIEKVREQLKSCKH